LSCSNPGISNSCRTITAINSEARLWGSATHPSFKFSFTIYALGGQTKTVTDTYIKISCSTTVKVSFSGSIAPVVYNKWPKTENGKGGEQSVIIDA
jgi:hypothetical protein